MLSTLLGVVLVLVTVAVVFSVARARTARRPRTDDAQLLRLSGQVISQHRLTLRWTIRYPLPDGSPNEILVERTLPERLREGMAVAVLVDPADPRRARLELPERTAFVRKVLIGVAVFLTVAVVLGALFAVPLFSRG